MPPDERKPPGRGGLSGNVVVAGSLDTPRDNPSSPKEQLDPSGLSDLRFRRDVTRLCELGSRAVAELLAEIGEQGLCR